MANGSNRQRALIAVVRSRLPAAAATVPSGQLVCSRKNTLNAADMILGSNATLIDLFARRVEQSGESIALRAPVAGRYRSFAWMDIARDVARWAVALKRAGVAPGDRVIQVAENRYEWILAELAIHFVGGVHVAVHATLSGPQIAFQIRDTGAKIVLISGQVVAEQIATVDSLWPAEVEFYSYEPVAITIGSRPVLRWQPAAELFAKAYPATQQASDTSGSAAVDLRSFGQLTADAVASAAPGDLATIL